MLKHQYEPIQTGQCWSCPHLHVSPFIQYVAAAARGDLIEPKGTRTAAVYAGLTPLKWRIDPLHTESIQLI